MIAVVKCYKHNIKPLVVIELNNEIIADKHMTMYYNE